MYQQAAIKKPQICFADNLKAVADALKKIVILTGDYAQTEAYATTNTLFYPSL